MEAVNIFGIDVEDDLASILKEEVNKELKREYGEEDELWIVSTQQRLAEYLLASTKTS
jgi:hypothetical protein